LLCDPARLAARAEVHPWPITRSTIVASLWPSATWEKTMRLDKEWFYAILLDVDNGLDPLTATGNADLYDNRGVTAA